MASPMINDRTLALIKRYEGFRSCPYLPTPNDRWTRGYGRTAGITRTSSCISEADAAEELRENITENYAPPVDRALARYGFDANENQRGALVSLVYNLGPGILDRGRSMGDALASRSRLRIAAAFRVYVKQGSNTLLGLVRRRAAEVKLFLTPDRKSELEKARAELEKRRRQLDKTTPERDAGKRRYLMRRIHELIYKIDRETAEDRVGRWRAELKLRRWQREVAERYGYSLSYLERRVDELERAIRRNR